MSSGSTISAYNASYNAADDYVSKAILKGDGEGNGRVIVSTVLATAVIVGVFAILAFVTMETRTYWPMIIFAALLAAVYGYRTVQGKWVVRP